MRRGVAVILGIVFLVALPALAEDTQMAPGGIRVHGFTNEFEQFYLDVTVAQGGVDLYQIQAVKIYSEPSHTLLFAQVDDAAPVFILTSVQGETPVAMTTNTIGAGLIRVNIPAPPSGDTRIRVDYVRLDNGTGKSATVAEFSNGSLLTFDFSAEPMAGRYKLCGYCSGSFCGCVYCPTPLLTTCCPGCSVFCGIVTCP